MRHVHLSAGLSVLALLALTACAGGAAPDDDAAVSSGDPAFCPGEILDVVVSGGAWGDVVRRLGGDCATVTTIAASSAAPHDVTPADLAAFAGADLVVVNGARYDDWAADAAEAATGDPVVVDAAGVAGIGGSGADPHLWYDPEVVPEVGTAVARELARLSPDAAPYFDAQHATWTAELQPYLETVAALRTETGGRTFAATGDVFGRMAEAVGLTDVTPPGYLRSARTGSDPSSDDLAAFEATLRNGTVDVLIQDGSAGGSVADQLREVADDADVPLVEVSVSPADDAPFIEWQMAQLASLADALGEDR